MWTQLFSQFGAGCQGGDFFGIPTWYKYLASSGLMTTDAVTKSCELAGHLKPDDWVKVVSLIALAMLDIVLRIAGIAAVIFVIYGGVNYILSDGEPDKTKRAQETIINALIGLVIALISVALVAFIGNKIGT